MALSDYVIQQLRFFGRLSVSEQRVLKAVVPSARRRTQATLERFVAFKRKFDCLNSHHSMIFLYRLAVELGLEGSSPTVCEKLFLLNRMMNGVDLYYKIAMPEHFLIGHGLGTVLSRAQYGNFVVIFQNVTIGVQNGEYPSIGEGTVIYANSVIAGNTVIGRNCVIGAGARLINKKIPDNTLVVERSGKLVFRENESDEVKNISSLNDAG